MRRLLYLAYHFPPDGGAGVFRTAKFVRYLPEFGWDPVVVAPRPEHDVRDPSLSRETEQAEVHRVPGLQPLRLWRNLRGGEAPGEEGRPPPASAGGAGRALRGWVRRVLFFPDEAVFWTPSALVEGARLGDLRGVEAVLATQPNSLLLAGALMARRLGLPFVSDFRDAWVPFVRIPRLPLRRRLEQPLEAMAVRSSRLVLCNTPGMARGFRARYGLDPARLPHLPNGYDPADFPPDAPCHTGEAPPPAPAGKPLEVVYAGALYGDYNPLAFLRAMGRALRSGLVPAGGLRARFYGAHDRAVTAAMEEVAGEEGIADLVDCPGHLPHAEAVRAQLDAGLGLILLPPGPGDAWRITAKTYEALATGRPILAMVPEGDARDLLERSGAALAIVDADDVEGAARALGEAWRRLQEGSLAPRTRWDVVRRFDRRRITAQLAALLDRIAGRPR